MFKLAVIATFFGAFTCAHAQSPDIKIVPGSGVAYLYFPTDGDTRATLKVIKETNAGLDSNYEVYLSFENGPQELLCSDLDQDCEKTLTAGTATLEIKGDWVPGNPSVVLAKNGAFSGACSGISTTCQLTLQAGETHIVRIKVGCDAHGYSVVSLGGGDTALCVLPVSLDGQNKVLLAAHQTKDIASKKKAKQKKSYWGNTSNTNGQDNTNIIQNNWSDSDDVSAANHCHNLNLGSGTSKLMKWYLPAINELEKAVNGWKDDDFVVQPIGDNGYISSTDTGGKKHIKAIEKTNNGVKFKSYNLKYKYGADVLCFKGVSPS